PGADLQPRSRTILPLRTCHRNLPPRGGVWLFDAPVSRASRRRPLGEREACHHAAGVRAPGGSRRHDIPGAAASTHEVPCPARGRLFKTRNGLPHAGRAASRLEMASPARGAPLQGLKPLAPSGGAASRPEPASPASPVASEGPLGPADVKCASRAEADFSASAAPGTLRTLNARHPERRRIGPILADCRNGLATRLTIHVELGQRHDAPARRAGTADAPAPTDGVPI